jgi:hypothetical protein
MTTKLQAIPALFDRRPTTIVQRRFFYGFTAIKSGTQVNVTPLHNPVGWDVVPGGKEICRMSLFATVLSK